MTLLPKLDSVGLKALDEANEWVQRQADALDDLREPYLKLSAGEPMNRIEKRKVIEHLRLSPDEVEELHAADEFSQEHLDFLFKTPAAHFYSHDEDGKLWRVDVVHGEEPRAIAEDDPDFE